MDLWCAVFLLLRSASLSTLLPFFREGRGRLVGFPHLPLLGLEFVWEVLVQKIQGDELWKIGMFMAELEVAELELVEILLLVVE